KCLLLVMEEHLIKTIGTLCQPCVTATFTPGTSVWYSSILEESVHGHLNPAVQCQLIDDCCATVEVGSI
ncbi:hypothetical protein L9F63_018244, partial [Diploptera punctata]